MQSKVRMSFKHTNALLKSHNCQLRWRDSNKKKVTVFREEPYGEGKRTLAIGLFRTDELHKGLADPTFRRPPGLTGNGKTGWEDHSYTDNGFDYTTPTFTPSEIVAINNALMLDKLTWK